MSRETLHYTNILRRVSSGAVAETRVVATVALLCKTESSQRILKTYNRTVGGKTLTILSADGRHVLQTEIE